MTHTLVGAVRMSLTGTFLAFGLWSALPALSQLEMPARLALPTAMTTPQPAASAAARSGASATASVSLTDADLTRSAQPYFPQTVAGVTLSSPSVRVTAGRVVLSATARSFIGSGPLVAIATPSVSDGRLIVRVDSATLGGIALPETMSAQIAEQLQAAIDAYMGSRMHVSQVTTGSGTLTLKGTTSP